MGYPTYFSEFPNIKYPYKINKAGVVDTFTIKDFFHLLVLRDEILAEDTIYDPFTINNGERPDQIAYELYGDEALYWIILQVNDIVDVHNEWPLSSYELEEYIVKKYGSIEAANDVHHYETIQTYDDAGNLVLPGRGGLSPLDRGGVAKSGLIVPENYTFTYQLYPGRQERRTLSGSTGRYAACTPISNRLYEHDMNENKSQIWILQKKYLSKYLAEVYNYTSKISDIDASLDVSDI